MFGDNLDGGVLARLGMFGNLDPAYTSATRHAGNTHHSLPCQWFVLFSTVQRLWGLLDNLPRLYLLSLLPLSRIVLDLDVGYVEDEEGMG